MTEQNFVLLIYNGYDQLIRNVTAKNNPHFVVSDLIVDDFDHLNLFVYAMNQNGKSDNVHVSVNNLVGQPRKLGKNISYYYI